MSVSPTQYFSREGPSALLSHERLKNEQCSQPHSPQIVTVLAGVNLSYLNASNLSVTAARALELREHKPAPVTVELIAILRERVPGMGPDRDLSPELEAAYELLMPR